VIGRTPRDDGALELPTPLAHAREGGIDAPLQVESLGDISQLKVIDLGAEFIVRDAAQLPTHLPPGAEIPLGQPPPERIGLGNENFPPPKT